LTDQERKRLDAAGFSGNNGRLDAAPGLHAKSVNSLTPTRNLARLRAFLCR
jgi:hypothetical protein